MDTNILALINTPVDVDVTESSCFQILQMEDNRLGLAMLSNVSLRLWERKVESTGVTRWMLQKTIELDKLLSLRSPMETSWQVILGYDEDGHTMFIGTAVGVFMIQRKSLQFRNLFKTNILIHYHPYASFYTTGNIFPLVAAVSLMRASLTSNNHR